MKKKRTPAQQARNNFLKREAARLIREETARLKAEEELQQIKSERRQRPEVMWARLIEESGQEFKDYVPKPAKKYNFSKVEKSF
tara:strand:+ start:644 stop:895 length:252 start_codon:yes stop_codon:yes gene_type:complete